MDATSYSKLKALHATWWDLPLDERAAWLASLSETERTALAPLLEPSTERIEGLPKQLGPYRIIRTLGCGGMAEVLLGERVDDFKQTVALKWLHSAQASRALKTRFIRERHLLAQLRHPNIAVLFDGGEHEQRLWFAMEYIEGDELLLAARAWSEDAKLRGFMQLCGAVAYAHQCLILHRDLKPGNILVSREGRIVLLDFGIARSLQADEEQTQGYSPLTMRYASPEQLSGEGLDVRSDVYQLGLVLCELLVGELHREDAELVSLKLAPDLRAILRQALAPLRAERYRDVHALADDVQRYLSHQPVLARPARWWYRTFKFVRRNPALTAMLATAALATGLGILSTQRQARIAEKNAQVALGLLSLAAPQDYGREYRIADYLVSTAERVAEEFADQPTLAFEGLLSVANGLLNLAEPDAAHAVLQRAEPFARRLPDAAFCTWVRLQAHAAREGQVLTDLERARQHLSLRTTEHHGCLHALAVIANRGKTVWDRATLDDMLGTIESRLQLDPPQSGRLEDITRQLARIYLAEGKGSEALRFAQWSASLSESAPDTYSPLRRAEAQHLLAQAAALAHAWERAEQAVRLALPSYRASYPAEHPELQALRALALEIDRQLASR
jgi:serine/threonine protein kinase